MKEVKVVIYSEKGENNVEETLHSLYIYLKNLRPARVFLALDSDNEKISNFLHDKLSAVPIESLQCRIVSAISEDSSMADQEVKRKILAMGLDTIAKYVYSNFSTMEAINSEVTISLFRAFFQFYSSAMPADYSAFYESRRFCLLGQLIHMRPENGDIIIVPPWDAYWFIDELQNLLSL